MGKRLYKGIWSICKFGKKNQEKNTLPQLCGFGLCSHLSTFSSQGSPNLFLLISRVYYSD